MNHSYRCMRSLNITDELISKTKDHVYKTILICRKSNLHITPSTRLFEDHIIYRMINIVGRLADKSEDHFERAHQVGKRSERI